MTTAKKSSDGPMTGLVFVKAFRHYKTGKLIKAEDYGKKVFVFKRR